jgi:hypothetical protein
MKTNKAEREAIASKFIKRMEEKLVLKTQELSKTKDFKDIKKNIEEREKLQEKLNSLDFDVREQIAKYNKDNPSEYWKLSEETYYRYRQNDVTGLRLKLESKYSIQPILTESILIAQVGAETVDELFEYLEREVVL